MKLATVTLKGASPYSQSKNIDKMEHPEKPKESKDAYEQRTWKLRAHVNSDGFVVIPQTALSHCVKQAARRLQLQIPGKGKTQYTKYFEAGVSCMDDIVTTTHIGTIKSDRLFVPSDGKPGGGTRVYRTFPRIDNWSGQVRFVVYDDIIPEDVFLQVLKSAGVLVGIGRFRPENRGFYGRFTVDAFDWDEEGAEALFGQKVA